MPRTQLEMQGGSRSREEHSRNEAQDHWEHLVLTELGGHIQTCHGFDSEPAYEFTHSPENCWSRSWNTSQVPPTRDLLV